MDDRTERRYEALRRRINREYRQAEKELREKMEEFFAKSAERDKKKRQELADGKITMQEYQRWLRGQVFQGKRWQEKVDQMARQLTQVDESATAIVNGERLNVFADNMNYQNGEAERIIGARFDLYDQATVARLLDEQPNLLPPRRVKRNDDIPWYHKLINNCVTQGILQGESVPQIADRIGEQTGERGRTAMLRNARTAVTSAQNAGRIEAMHQQEQMGIRVQKKWIAAIDNRTRDAHRDPALAEQVIDIDQPFKTKLGEILFPGDPAAHPANVYNCRCTLGYVYPEYQPEINQPLSSPYGEAVKNVSIPFRKHVEEDLNNAPQIIRDVWTKHQASMTKPVFDLPGDDAHFNLHDGNTHYSSEQKAYGRSTYQEENAVYFHEYGHNIDFLATGAPLGTARYFSAEYDNGAFPKMIHQEIEEHMRGYYLATHPKADFWWERDGFDYIEAASRQKGADSLEQMIRSYWMPAQLGMDRRSYKSVLQEINNSGGDRAVLRSIWERHMAGNQDVQKNFQSDQTIARDSEKRKTYVTKDNAEKLADHFKMMYNQYELSDISDMFDSYYDPMFGLNKRITTGHKPGYFGNNGAINWASVATEGFAEMFSATATANASLDMIKKCFPKSYDIFLKMLEAMK